MAARASSSAGPAVYRIGRYRIRARLGKGGMGVVYVARDEALDRDVAVKTLRIEGTGDAETRGRFEIEARAAARLQHPNIVTVFELGEDRGLPFIAMEMLSGADLESMLRSSELLSIAERLDIVVQTLRGLAFAHEHRIVHRDVKPSNIRVLDDGVVKILDFGIAKVESASVTQAGMMVGTPYYMSPEQIRGRPLDGRSDLFSTGVMLYEMFARRRPFTATEPAQILYGIVHEAPPPLGPTAAGPFTARLQRVIDHALAKSVDERYATAGEMAADLAEIRASIPSSTLPPRETATLAAARQALQAGPLTDDLSDSVLSIASTYPDALDAQRTLRAARRSQPAWRETLDTGSYPELDQSFAGSMGAAATAAMSSPGASAVAGPNDPTGVLTRSAHAPSEASAHPETGPGDSRRKAALAFAGIGVAALVAAAVIAVAFRPSSSPPASPVSDPGPPPRVASEPAGGASSPAPVGPARAEPGSQRPAAEPRVSPRPARASGGDGRRAAVGAQPPLATSPPSASTPPPPRAPARDATLRVESAYPLSVRWLGRTIIDGAGGSAAIGSGTVEVTLEAPDVFLRRRETVTVATGETATIQAPGLGRLSVLANPDNCRVFLNGQYVDFVPIRDRAVAAGAHDVEFVWADGARSQQRIQVQAGRPAYVTGRKP